VSQSPGMRSALERAAAGTPVTWDPHPSGPDPVARCRLVTPNRKEAGAPADMLGVEARARELRRAWRADAVVITLGDSGALLVSGDGPALAAPAPRLSLADTCGAGDRFASAAAAALAAGARVEDAVAPAVRSASAFVAAGGASGAVLGPPLAADPVHGLAAARELVEAVRRRGGRVVATGGCFDLLHAGHVASLAAARRLGDCLVVLLNSDASVRRRKGPGRPLVAEADRAAVLAGLRPVDAVVVFDEDTPEPALSRLRPDVFAKGADYSITDLPEKPLLESWGGQVVLLPYLDGRSTTRLLQEASARAGH
jgi:D-beta-D-heptose 7-phosphate kinase / D-beta-D-heptose 1-phosphate adenosyltransferase